MDLVDLMTSRSERDKGLQKVSLNNDGFMWMALQLLTHVSAAKDNPKLSLYSVFPTREFTGEDIRSFITQSEIEPAHSNAFGALIMTAIKRKIIVPTGAYTSMKSSSSHARKTAVYRWA